MKVYRERATTIRAKSSPSSFDLYWIAGFLEGEGTFFATVSNSHSVKAAQLQREPLERLQRWLGGTISKRPPSLRPTRRSSGSYIWSISGARARGVMLTIFPLLSPKRQQQVRFALRG